MSIRFHPKKWFFGALLTITILIGIGYWWRGNPSPLRWSDLREGDGAVLSLAAGLDSIGNEIIVAGGYFRTDDSGRDLRVLCYDASNGRVRWEARENTALPNMMINSIITIDPAGDMIIGWETAAAQVGRNKAISKFAGTDGHLLWGWSLDNTDSGTSITAIPTPSQSDALWVSGIHKISGEHRRFIAVLDTKTGVQLWMDDLNSARDGFDRPAQIQHLKNGDALVLIPPRGGEGKFPWTIQLRTGKYGTIQWQYEMIRENDRSLQSIEWLADEPNNQVIVSWNSVSGGRMHYDFVALGLATGRENWHVRDIVSTDDFISGVEAVTRGNHSGIELWGRHIEDITHTYWWRWRMEDGIPYPERETEVIEQPLRITLSSSDGSITTRELLAHDRERVIKRLAKPGRTSVEALLLGRFDDDKFDKSEKLQMAQWRCAQTHASLLGGFHRDPVGKNIGIHFPDHAILTPSGKLVIAGDPAEDKRQWQIKVW